jgi:hypothetical protein
LHFSSHKKRAETLNEKHSWKVKKESFRFVCRKNTSIKWENVACCLLCSFRHCGVWKEGYFVLHHVICLECFLKAPANILAGILWAVNWNSVIFVTSYWIQKTNYNLLLYCLYCTCTVLIDWGWNIVY